MPNKNYLRGRRFEYDTQKSALSNGADMSFRTAGSHGPYDVISFFPKQKKIVLVQCKTKLTDSEPMKGIITYTDHIDTFDWHVTCYKATKYIARRTK